MHPQHPSASMWGWMCFVGLMGFVGQATMSRGGQLEKAGPAAMMRNLDVVFAFVLQISFLAETPSGGSVAGAILITVRCKKRRIQM